MATTRFNAGMINAFVPGQSSRLSPEEEALIARRERLLGPAYRLFYEDPVHIVRGEGVWLYDPAGQAYLDVYNNVASVGHCHPHVLKALTRQAATLNTHTRYLHETILDYAEKLLATFPTTLGNVMFTCTGSEANDLALRIAQAYTGGTGIIVTALAYHGITSAIAAMSPSLGQYSKLGDHVRTVPAPDLYHSDGQDVGAVFAANVKGAIADLKAQGVKVAALFCDTIFSSDGVFSDPPGFLADAVDAVHAEGGLFVADEVQPGFGRTGTHMWGFLRHNVAPDLVTIGKPMGNGQPIAGVVTRPELVEEFGRRARYFNTFGGNPVSCAAGLAVLEVIENEGLMDNARIVGAYLREGLRQIANRHDVIGDVRGAGLFIGVELVRDRATKEPDPETTARLVNGLRDRRILISAAGPGANVLKVRPPLVFTKANADMFLDAVDDVLSTPRA
jgi:4-aminobutyrate aminotransferase-like enzyme